MFHIYPLFTRKRRWRYPFE